MKPEEKRKLEILEQPEVKHDETPG